AALLRHPGQDLHVMMLAAEHAPGQQGPGAREVAGGTLRVGDPGDAGEMLDAEARAAYRSRLAELREERDEAERFNDPGRVARAEREIGMLTQELARAVGLGGRARRAGAAAERARLNVTRAIAAVLRKIAAEHHALGVHLAATIRTGTFCCYAADDRSPV